MSVEVNKGGLAFTARIDTSQLEKDSKRVEKIISDQAKKSEKDFQKITKNLSSQSKQIVTDASQAFDQLDPKYKRLFTNLQLYASQLDKLKLAQKELNNQLKSGAITQGQYNKALAGIRAEASQATQAMKALAAETQSSGRVQQQRWDGLGNSIAQVTRELPAFTYSAQTGFLAISNNIPILADEISRLRVKNQQLTASGQKAVPVWQQVLKGFLSWQTVLSVGITLLTVYGKEIGAFIKGLFSGKDALDQTRQSQEALSKAFSSSEMSKAIESISDLRTNLNLAKDGLIDKQTVIEQYNESIGKVTTQVNTLKEVEQGLIDNADNYVKATLFKAAADAAKEEIGKKLLDNAKEQLESEQRLIEAQSELAREQEKNQKRFVFTPSGQAIETASLEENDVAYFERKVELAQKANDKIIQSGNELIEALKKQSLATGIDLFSEDPKVIDTLSKRKDLLEEIAKLDREYAQVKVNDDQAEILALRDKFQRVRELVNEFNSDPKNAKVQIEVEAIDSIEAEAEKNLIYTQETKTLKDELEERKKLYNEFENYVKDFGLNAAKERFQGEIDTTKRFIEILQDEYNKLATIDPGDRNGLQNERLEFLSKFLEYEKREEQSKYDDLLKSLQGYEEQRALIIEGYAAQRQQLIQNGNQAEVEALEEKMREELRVLDEGNIEKQIKLEDFFRSLERVSMKEAKARIKVLRESLIKAYNEGGLEISESFLEQILGSLDKWENQLEQKIPKALIGISNEFRNIAQTIGETNKGLGLMFSTLSDILGRAADIKTNIEGIKAVQAQGGTGGLLTSLTSGIGFIGAALGIVGTIANAFDQAAKRQVEATRAILKLKYQEYDAELEIQRIYREKAILKAKENRETLASIEEQRAALQQALTQINESSSGIFGMLTGDLDKKSSNRLDRLNEQLSLGINKYNKFLAELESQVYITGTREVRSGFLGFGRQVVNTYGTLAGKSFEEIFELFTEGKLVGRAKELVEEMIKLKEEGEDIEQQLKALEESYKQILTGGATADSIADTIIQGFQQGKRAVEDFGEDVEAILRNAILSGFKYKFLEGPLNELLDQLFNDLKDDQELDPGEISSFQNAFNVSTPPSTSFIVPLPAVGLPQKQTYEKSKSTTNGSGSSFLQVQRPYPAGILSA